MSFIERINTRIETADDLMFDARTEHDLLGDIIGSLQRRLDCARCTGGIASLENVTVSLRVLRAAIRAAREEAEASV